MNIQVHASLRRRQRGAALVISLLFLLVLTVLGVTSMSTTGLQERMAGNLRESNLAFQAAESALTNGETWLGGVALTTRPQPCTSSCTSGNGVWDSSVAIDWNSWTSAQWASNAREFGHDYDTGDDEADLDAELAEEPRYLVQQVGFRPDSLVAGSTDGTYYYAVTARGTGRSSLYAAILQTVYTRRF